MFSEINAREIFTPSAPERIVIIFRAMHLSYVLVYGYSAWKINGYWFLHISGKFSFS